METQNVGFFSEKSLYSNLADRTILANGLTDEQLQAAEEVSIPELSVAAPSDVALEIDLLA